jgi:hypothetical protein
VLQKPNLSGRLVY